MMYSEMYGEETTPGYGIIAWSQNPSGYPSGYPSGDTMDTKKSSPEYDRAQENKGLQKQGDLESLTQKFPTQEKFSGKGDQKIYDSQDRHPFSFGLGISSNF